MLNKDDIYNNRKRNRNGPDTGNKFTMTTIGKRNHSIGLTVTDRLTNPFEKANSKGPKRPSEKMSEAFAISDDVAE